MQLAEEDIALFYKLHNALLAYTNAKLGVIKEGDLFQDNQRDHFKDKAKIREKLYHHPELFDAFVAENPAKFSAEELEIIESWKNFIREKFIIFRYLKNYTIFLDINNPPKAYGVLSLITPLPEMFEQRLPIMVEATLLPFKDKIIYDGILEPYFVSFGGGFRRILNASYQKAKLNFGIITSLPFLQTEPKQNDAEKLKFYLKNEQNRERYSEEIQELIQKDESLFILYHQEMGKAQARRYRKYLRDSGIQHGWFAILEGLIIASGKTKESAEKVVQDLVPKKKRKYVYLFELKKK